MNQSIIMSGANLLDNILDNDIIINAAHKLGGVAYGSYVSRVLYPASLSSSVEEISVPTLTLWFPTKGCINILRKLNLLCPTLHLTTEEAVVRDTLKVTLNASSKFIIDASGVALTECTDPHSLVTKNGPFDFQDAINYSYVPPCASHPIF